MITAHYYAEYVKAIQKMEHFTRLKEKRVTELENLYDRIGKDAEATETLIDRDVEVNKYGGKAARWAGVAAAYGPGALIHIFLSTDRGSGSGDYRKVS